MIDVHCHFDMAKNPEIYIAENERKRVITIGMTNLPSHFQLGFKHVKKYNFIRLALGLHPLRAKEHAKEYSIFNQLVNETSYIGEVGLDFSPQGFTTKEIQIRSFEFVLNNINKENKILSLHSRRAEKETLEIIVSHGIQNAIFHWYSGNINTLKKIIDNDFYFSINTAMLYSDNGKKIITEIPREFVLTETDFPYLKNNNLSEVYPFLSNLWKIPLQDVENIIDNNFKNLINKIKTCC
jgi:TatD DNase family protein